MVPMQRNLVKKGGSYKFLIKFWNGLCIDQICMYE